jgi:hypothetical protein
MRYLSLFAGKPRIFRPTVLARVTVNRGLMQLISPIRSSFRFTNACNSVSVPIPVAAIFSINSSRSS